MESHLSLQQSAPDHSKAEDSEPSARPLRILKIVISLAVLGFVVWLVATGRLTMEQVNRFARDLPTWLFLPAYLVLPLLGFPISALLIASGLKYGFWFASAISIGAMAFHTFAAWHITHGFLRQRIKRLLRSTQFDLPKIPKSHQVWMTLVFVTVPGLPYWVKLYSLALTNLPFRRYFLLTWLGHAINAILLIGVGAAAADVNPWVLAGLLLLAVGSGYAMKQVRERFIDEDDEEAKS